MKVQFEPLPEYVEMESRGVITVPVSQLPKFAEWVQAHFMVPMTEYLTRTPAFETKKKGRRGRPRKQL